MGNVATYSPEDVSVAINGSVLSGFADGTFVLCEREVDSFVKHVGADGKVTRSKSANKSGMITLTLTGSSASNDVLSALSAKDEIDGSGVAPAIVKDNSGRTVCAGKGWIRKPPGAEFATEIGDREWIFDIDNLTMFIGGNETQ